MIHFYATEHLQSPQNSSVSKGLDQHSPIDLERICVCKTLKMSGREYQSV